jgi:hypothetical protein
MINAPRRYYSSRNKKTNLTPDELYEKLHSLYSLFNERDYFKGSAGITAQRLPDTIKHEARIGLEFQPFPITEWTPDMVTEDHIFDTIEFLFDHVSKPGPIGDFRSDSGWNYSDYDGYDKDVGQMEFRGKANSFLRDYAGGYELSRDGRIQKLGTHGLEYILEADIPKFDDANVDSKVRGAISKWRNRNTTTTEKREAIRDLADVFEWLKKNKQLSIVLDKKDETVLFELANSFGIRHHDPKQKTNYDKSIWYSWMFHFYLSTYHAVIRMLLKNNKNRT